MTDEPPSTITSALAAFGPGGMIGGPLLAGTLVSVSGGGVAVGLASPAAIAQAVEAYFSTQLRAALLRTKQCVHDDLTTWEKLAATRIELGPDLARLEAVSDDGAPALKQLQRKLKAIDRALTYLNAIGLGPESSDGPDTSPVRAAELLERATEAFRSVDLDGDGIPDKARARTTVEDAGTAIRGAATGAAGAVGSLLRRRQSGERAQDLTLDESDPGRISAP